jgi:hypothetical protein
MKSVSSRLLQMGPMISPSFVAAILFFSREINESVDLRLYPPILSVQPNTFHMQINKLQLLIFCEKKENSATDRTF